MPFSTPRKPEGETDDMYHNGGPVWHKQTRGVGKWCKSHVVGPCCGGVAGLVRCVETEVIGGSGLWSTSGPVSSSVPRS